MRQQCLVILCLAGMSLTVFLTSCTQGSSPKKSPAKSTGGSSNNEKFDEKAAYAFKVTWDKVDDADTYKVYGYVKGSSKTWVLTEVDADSEETTQSAVVDDSEHEFDKGEKACFAVKAFKKAGQESEFSGGICETI